MHYPGEPNFAGPMGAWLRRLLRAAISNQLQPAPGYRIRRTPGGTFLGLDPSAGGGGSFSLHRFKSIQAEYLVCRTWDGTTEGTEDVNIAKPYLLRQSITSRTMHGTPITYTYPGGATSQTRQATGSGRTETGFITEAYVVNDIIWAVRATTLVTVSGTALSLLDANVDGRCWGAIEQ